MDKLFKSLATTLLVFFSLTIFWSMGMGMDMDTMSHDMQGMTFICPIMPGYDTACGMDAIQHFTLWKQTFSATFQAGWMLVVGIAIFRFFEKNRIQFFEEKRRFPSRIPPAEQRQRESFGMIFNPVLQSLSEGILAPKLYA